MNILIVKNRSRLDDNLVYEIGETRTWCEWCEGIEKMDPNIISVTITPTRLDTIIKFKSEEHKNWFLLRWS